jgi:ABC-2 type transport system permease protein
LAVAISFSLRFIMNLCAFWILDYRGVFGLSGGIFLLFSGFVVPIPFFPSPLRGIARALPFAGMFQTPIDVFLQKSGPGGVVGLLVVQAVWTVVLLGLGRLVLVAAFRRVVVQGG